ncbi:SpoVG family protein [Thermoanaerobacterium thermosaccharolyticum]|uniref:SpoVG family protein n=1 Tax=Thermoanaerobacterium thermosaccharolyticum TaxID=1517 RepID=UPI002FD98D10
MQITKTEFRKYDKGGKIKGFCRVVFDDCFAIETRLIQGKNGVFVSFPNHRNKEGKYSQQAYPLTKEMRNTIIEAVLKAYKEA